MSQNNHKNLRSKIRQMVAECMVTEAKRINESKRREKKLDSIINEQISNFFKSKLNEDDNDSVKRKNVMAMLDDDKINDAEIMRELWHPSSKSEEDTYRSWFSKKKANDGFSNDEINKLYNILTAN